MEDVPSSAPSSKSLLERSTDPVLSASSASSTDKLTRLEIVMGSDVWEEVCRVERIKKTDIKEVIKRKDETFLAYFTPLLIYVCSNDM